MRYGFFHVSPSDAGSGNFDVGSGGDAVRSGQDQISAQSDSAAAAARTEDEQGGADDHPVGRLRVTDNGVGGRAQREQTRDSGDGASHGTRSNVRSAPSAALRHDPRQSHSAVGGKLKQCASHSS